MDFISHACFNIQSLIPFHKNRQRILTFNNQSSKLSVCLVVGLKISSPILLENSGVISDIFDEKR